MTKSTVIRWVRMIIRLRRDFAEASIIRLGLTSHRTQGNRDLRSVERLSYVLNFGSGRNCKTAADRGTIGSPVD